MFIWANDFILVASINAKMGVFGVFKLPPHTNDFLLSLNYVSQSISNIDTFLYLIAQTNPSRIFISSKQLNTGHITHQPNDPLSDFVRFGTVFAAWRHNDLLDIFGNSLGSSPFAKQDYFGITISPMTKAGVDSRGKLGNR